MNTSEGKKRVFFERAIFISWYCAKGDCKFCYMSTQKDKIADPGRARRSTPSILAEAILAKKLNWKIEFISGGIHSFSKKELVSLLNHVYNIYGEKLWLNLGVLDEDLIRQLLPITEGICSTVECINPVVHDQVCPSKPLSEVLEQFRICDRYNLKKSITIIIGLGESEDDIPLLIDFIRDHGISKMTFYALNPIRGTIFKKGPDKDYFLRWIKETRAACPDLHIVAGHWVDRVDYIREMIIAGADSITKYPAFRLFGSSHSKELERNIGSDFASNLTEMPDFDVDKELKKYGFEDRLNSQVKGKIERYLEVMRKGERK
ncbi:radical SAM protein [Candidatus Woesearchaeota archaeon]|nr:radical SAM protein [Candidatus Woesearchaeota archaeon]